MVHRAANSRRWCSGESPPDDGFLAIENPPTHQFADPFPFVHGGVPYLFFESYSYRDRRASIWFIPLDASGRPAAKARPALERDYHLSYPFVFGYGREIFMIPESSENRTIDLYRAIRFPEEWRLEQTLFSGVRAVDATIHEADGAFTSSPISRRKEPPSTTNSTSFRRPARQGRGGLTAQTR